MGQSQDPVLYGPYYISREIKKFVGASCRRERQASRLYSISFTGLLVRNEVIFFGEFCIRQHDYSSFNAPNTRCAKFCIEAKMLSEKYPKMKPKSSKANTFSKLSSLRNGMMLDAKRKPVKVETAAEFKGTITRRRHRSLFHFPLATEWYSHLRSNTAPPMNRASANAIHLALSAVTYLSAHPAGRHGFFTELVVRQGVDPVTAAKAGRWSDPNLPMRIYAHAETDEADVRARFRTNHVQADTVQTPKSTKSQKE
ncbi:hypothetical protein [Pseudaestuariivita atlantica]|uniref:hypothetical protein n=1 Tax=Pseudaestuariivita atlantica TaxID=1317121 RepID=UPI000A8526EE|nr:hypothetical protein [Pseudaestuariivita atlantica]